MRSALAVFCERGFDATTIENITERADLGKGTFYRHFDGKNEILQALLAESATELAMRIHRETSAAKTVGDTVDGMLKAHRSYAEENRTEFILLCQGKIFLQLRRSDMSDLAKPFDDYVSEIQRAFARHFPAADARRLKRFAAMVGGILTGLFLFGADNLTGTELEASLGFLRQICISSVSAFARDGDTKDGKHVQGDASSAEAPGRKE